MKLTKQIKDAKDKYGHPIDFTYCRKCHRFVHFEDNEIGDDITCCDCGTDKYLV
jgi:hypothetical protein